MKKLKMKLLGRHIFFFSLPFKLATVCCLWWRRPGAGEGGGGGVEVSCIIEHPTLEYTLIKLQCLTPENAALKQAGRIA